MKPCWRTGWPLEKRTSRANEPGPGNLESTKAPCLKGSEPYSGEKGTMTLIE